MSFNNTHQATLVALSAGEGWFIRQHHRDAAHESSNYISYLEEELARNKKEAERIRNSFYSYNTEQDSLRLKNKGLERQLQNAYAAESRALQGAENLRIQLEALQKECSALRQERDEEYAAHNEAQENFSNEINSHAGTYSKHERLVEELEREREERKNLVGAYDQLQTDFNALSALTDKTVSEANEYLNQAVTAGQELVARVSKDDAFRNEAFKIARELRQQAQQLETFLD